MQSVPSAPGPGLEPPRDIAGFAYHRLAIAACFSGDSMHQLQLEATDRVFGIFFCNSSLNSH
jgi:hypothetical protein